jgi:adenylate kinase
VIARPEYKGYMNILLVGIQGSGKGTLARKLVEKFGYNFFEMGQKLRNFAGLDEPESGVVRDLLAKGSLVSPELVERILLHYQSGHTGAPILFDGIPRTPEQKNLFDRVFPEYIVLFLDLSREMAIERLGGRRIDPVTGESFPRSFEGNFSPFTGNELVHREDDNPSAVSKRIDTFYANTLPLLALWAGEGKRVYTIDASQSIEDCAKQAEVVVGAYSTK